MKRLMQVLVAAFFMAGLQAAAQAPLAYINTAATQNLNLGSYTLLAGGATITGALSGGSLSLSGAAAIGGTLTVTGTGNAFQVTNGSATIAGMLFVGYNQVTTACGAGVTTCTASCAAGNVAVGCGNCSVASVAGLSVATGGSSDLVSCTCTALTATTITSRSYCARLGN